ncbi:pilus assembly protein CpaF [Ectothiorhodosinus mongolicus]|uniref:Pilus assembly protein CpaF n=1 Tax=Ectothiorhodosinus mongolicus TaxID=233100 RepID=A0A1R3VM72_9GAMM|nr:CpaF family protein [Ectothiorhodosinus mongolicus]ULX57773.1 pilus assembly protein CpaF [Ectothiorhodosinus mongolicus]SIT65636.1 pilus assembly protein CpaF [Ectothiorhodosinus mongolicus]
MALDTVGNTHGVQAAVAATNGLYEIKSRMHAELLEQLNLELIDQLDGRQVREQIGSLVRDILDHEHIPLNAAERTTLVDEMLDEVLGLGPIEPLLKDPTVSDILVNSHISTYVERRGVLEKSHVRFRNDAHLMRIIDKIAASVGRRIDESSPMVDARLADGSRVNAIIPPLAVDGPVLSIRKFSVDPYTLRDLVAFRSLTPGMSTFLQGAVKARLNIIISGGTGSGKTTLLNAMSASIPSAERVISIEDSAELQLQQPHVVRLETRPPNLEGKGEITQRDLVRNSLRMRPDRIIVGEVRGSEALDMLQAMNTGHEGSLSTIHANTPRDALTRMEHMVGMAGVSIPQPVVRQQIAAAIHLMVNIERMIDGRRVVTSIQEITGTEDEVVTMQEIFHFLREGVDPKGQVLGHFQATGIRPSILKRFQERGVDLDEALFDPDCTYE